VACKVRPLRSLIRILLGEAARRCGRSIGRACVVVSFSRYQYGVWPNWTSGIWAIPFCPRPHRHTHFRYRKASLPYTSTRRKHENVLDAQSGATIWFFRPRGLARCQVSSPRFQLRIGPRLISTILPGPWKKTGTCESLMTLPKHSGCARKLSRTQLSPPSLSNAIGRGR
jgi:hypothetical protein